MGWPSLIAAVKFKRNTIAQATHGQQGRETGGANFRPRNGRVSAIANAVDKSHNSVRMSFVLTFQLGDSGPTGLTKSHRSKIVDHGDAFTSKHFDSLFGKTLVTTRDVVDMRYATIRVPHRNVTLIIADRSGLGIHGFRIDSCGDSTAYGGCQINAMARLADDSAATNGLVLDPVIG
jgi:hypothetical protein